MLKEVPDGKQNYVKGSYMQPKLNADQIKQFIESNFSDLKSDRLENGWSFFYQTIKRGRNSTRIARVTQRPNGNVEFKPAVTARKENNKQLRVKINGGKNQIRTLIERELGNWKAI